MLATKRSIDEDEFEIENDEANGNETTHEGGNGDDDI